MIDSQHIRVVEYSYWGHLIVILKIGWAIARWTGRNLFEWYIDLFRGRDYSRSSWEFMSLSVWSLFRIWASVKRLFISYRVSTNINFYKRTLNVSDKNVQLLIATPLEVYLSQGMVGVAEIEYISISRVVNIFNKMIHLWDCIQSKFHSNTFWNYRIMEILFLYEFVQGTSNEYLELFNHILLKCIGI